MSTLSPFLVLRVHSTGVVTSICSPDADVPVVRAGRRIKVRMAWRGRRRRKEDRIFGIVCVLGSLVGVGGLCVVGALTKSFPIRVTWLGGGQPPPPLRTRNVSGLRFRKLVCRANIQIH